MNEYKIGDIVKGVVTGIENYGIFISFDEYYTGLIHISEVSHNFVKDLNDYVKVGDFIYTEILDIDDENGHLKLSIKNINYKDNGKTIKKKIVETPHGFTTLASKLPLWIEESLKNSKNTINIIDK